MAKTIKLNCETIIDLYLAKYWNNYGKLDSLKNTNKSIAMKFRYDPMGNRIEKRLYHLDGSGSVIRQSATHYVRDAQGNPLAVYDLLGGDTIVLSEFNLYGTNRLGMLTIADTLVCATCTTATAPSVYMSPVGMKRYELSNHLGNVMTVISDKPVPIDTTSDGLWDYFNASVVSATDYYPFGMLQPGRTLSSVDYRFGLMGYEKDNEISESGNSYDFDGYGYDPRTGRRKGPDPMTKKYPDESPYIFAGNNPVSLRDEDGKEKTYYLTRIAKDGTTTQLKVVDKYTVITQTTYTRESLGVGGMTLFVSPQIANTKTFDVAQNITLDERTGQITVSKEYATTERSNSSIVRAVEDNARELGNYLDEATNGGGGIVFTSEIGQGQETRKGYNADAQSENIDLLTAVLGAASSAATSKQATGFLEAFKQGVDAITIGKDVYDNTKGSSQSPTGTKKVTCGACGGDTIPASEQGSHTGPFTPVKEKK